MSLQKGHLFAQSMKLIKKKEDKYVGKLIFFLFDFYLVGKNDTDI